MSSRSFATMLLASLSLFPVTAYAQNAEDDIGTDGEITDSPTSLSETVVTATRTETPEARCASAG